MACTGNSSDIAKLKALARKEAIKVRDHIASSITAEELEKLSTHVIAALKPMKGVKNVSVFWSMGNEIDTRFLMRDLERAGYTVLLPRVVAPATPLAFHQWGEGDPLEVSRFGVSEPVADAPVLRPDVLLVPLLVFDKAGYRLGYGGGFYDRTLVELRKTGPVKAFGLAYEQQLVRAVPRDEFDQRLDLVITNEAHWMPQTPVEL